MDGEYGFFAGQCQGNVMDIACNVIDVVFMSGPDKMQVFYNGRNICFFFFYNDFLTISLRKTVHDQVKNIFYTFFLFGVFSEENVGHFVFFNCGLH